MAATPISNAQLTLALNQYVITGGAFPGSFTPTAPGLNYQGFILETAGTANWDAAAAHLADGSDLSIASNTALFAVYGTTFGGNGFATFALPDFNSTAAVGDGQGAGLPDFDIGQEFGANAITLSQAQLAPGSGGSSQAIDQYSSSLAINYLIRAFAGGGSDPVSGTFVGGIVKAGGNFAPDGYLIADGSTLAISNYTALFAAIGNQYGGDGTTTFKLPDLRGRDIVGVATAGELGALDGAPTYQIDQGEMPGTMGGQGDAIDLGSPSIGLRYIIALGGIDPSDGGDPGGPSTFHSTSAYVGQIVAYAGIGAIPTGWALADGSSLTVAGNQDLFDNVGYTYGGSGATFALPNLTGRTTVGAHFGEALGTQSGSATTTLTTANIPDLLIVGDGAGVASYGGDGADIFTGNGGNDSITGGGGEDVAHYAHARSAYTISRTGGTITLTDNSGTASDGVDTVTGVETFTFNGVTITAAELDRPVAVSDTITATDKLEDTSITIAASVLTGNDVDIDTSAALSIASVAGATHGTVQIVSGNVVFTPDANYNGPASFTYTVSDGTLTSLNSATATFTIQPVADAPVTADKAVTTLEDTGYAFAASDFAFNDVDTGDTLQSVVISSLPTEGTLTFGGVAVTVGQTIAIGAIGQLVFTPAANANGAGHATFGFKVGDGTLASAAKTITINVTPVNDAPTTVNDAGGSLVVAEDNALVITAASLLANDSDIESDAFSITSVTSGTGGTAVLNGDGTITFTPALNFFGNASFTYVATDVFGAASAPATATITVTPVNDAPVLTTTGGAGATGAVTINENGVVAANLTATDVDNASLTLSVGGTDAAAFVIENNVLKFKAAPDFEAPGDSDGNNTYVVTLTASDGLLTDAQELTITVADVGGNTISANNKNNRIDLTHAFGGKTATPEPDAIDGKGGDDTLRGGDSNDLLRGGDGRDDLGGGAGNDTLRGQDGNDLVRGGAGQDALGGGAGNDMLEGGAGTDTLRGGSGSDNLDGGAGIDTADYSEKMAGVVVTLNGTSLATVKVGGTAEDRVRDVENVIGGSRGDTLTGDKNANVLIGGAGGDQLDGAKGSDTLDGGLGHDTITGGRGGDLLTGGMGKDEFVFNTALGGPNVDTITDFVHDVDMIHLSDAIFAAVGAKLGAKEFHAAAGAVAGTDEKHRIVYDTATGNLYYDADGNAAGGEEAVLFATLSSRPLLDKGDFLVV